ncbi:hypothetical protein [Tenacibaculum jejuense]|uniref:Lipoprotein n=1 Tax=Tenacibaculum jejuense TaxID=584609 RepID=A0A238UF57_9FLAO|nr:hypothetical protein [Tenacibaculum jejuense]SNR17104.1 exported protein of unknown function [Tenacibaculum jejuense]
MKSLIVLLVIFFSFTSQKCSSQEQENLKIRFIKKFIETNKNDKLYFNSEELFFMGYDQNFEYESFKVIFLDSEKLNELIKNKKKLYVFSMSEPYIKEGKIKVFFDYLIASKKPDNELDLVSLHNMNAIYCMIFDCKLNKYIIEWCGTPLAD